MQAAVRAEKRRKAADARAAKQVAQAQQQALLNPKSNPIPAMPTVQLRMAGASAHLVIAWHCVANTLLEHVHDSELKEHMQGLGLAM